MTSESWSSSRGRAQPRIHERVVEEGKGDGVLPFSSLKLEVHDSGDVCRGTRQRFAKRSALQHRTAETIAALNSLAGFSTPLVDKVSEMGL